MRPLPVGTLLLLDRGPYPAVECRTTHAAVVVEAGFVQMTDEGLIFFDRTNISPSWFIAGGWHGRTARVTAVRELPA